MHTTFEQFHNYILCSMCMYCEANFHFNFEQISDLGLARKAGIFVPHEGGKFPIKWTAPEALKYSVSVASHVVLSSPYV